MGVAQAVEQHVMPVRPDWNAMGPAVPLWFRHRLRRIDPRLALQFMPPRDLVPGGVDPDRFPCGVWIICHRMRRTGWLFKRWHWALMDTEGNLRPPDMETLHLLQIARDLDRRGEADRLSDLMDERIVAIRRDAYEKSRESKIADMARWLMRRGVRQHGHNRVSMFRGSKPNGAGVSG